MVPLMKCGHAAQGTDKGGNPVCVICIGLDDGAKVVAEEPNLEGRKASCPYCHKQVDSSTNLPFFEHLPNRGWDVYYCGCRGWD